MKCKFWNLDHDDNSFTSCSDEATHFACDYATDEGQTVNVCFEHRCRCRGQRRAPLKESEPK